MVQFHWGVCLSHSLDEIIQEGSVARGHLNTRRSLQIIKSSRRSYQPGHVPGGNKLTRKPASNHLSYLPFRFGVVSIIISMLPWYIQGYRRYMCPAESCPLAVLMRILARRLDYLPQVGLLGQTGSYVLSQQISGHWSGHSPQRLDNLPKNGRADIQNGSQLSTGLGLQVPLLGSWSMG